MSHLTANDLKTKGVAALESVLAEHSAANVTCDADGECRRDCAAVCG